MNRQSGFTLVELTLVASLLAMVMAGIAAFLSAATTSIRLDDNVAVAMESLQRSAIRVSQVMRPCSISTYRVLSTAADVPLAATAAGEWIEPVDGEARPAIQFRSATGALSLNAEQLTDPRGFRIELENGETANGADDDNDGMVDEGRLMMDYDGIPVALASNLEAATFTLNGRLLTITLQSAARTRAGVMQRFVANEVLYLRNN
jgi:prepilin-type N-terminal cleavage/methylation domain-containing protein